MTQISTYEPYGISSDGKSDRFGHTGQMFIPELDLYSYLGNDPLNFTDPLGLAGCADKKSKSLQACVFLQAVMTKISMQMLQLYRQQ